MRIFVILWLGFTLASCASAPKPADCHGDFKPINTNQPVKKLVEVKCITEKLHG